MSPCFPSFVGMGCQKKELWDETLFFLLTFVMDFHIAPRRVVSFESVTSKRPLGHSLQHSWKVTTY